MPVVRLVLDARVTLWRAAEFVTGGSPWRMAKLAPSLRDLVVRLRSAGAAGLVPPASEAALAAVLVERGLAHPVPGRRPGPHDVTVVVPVYGRPASLARCLDGLRGVDVVVVDDATPHAAARVEVEDLARGHGATYHRLGTNRGPAAARNAGAAFATSGLVAFVDSDCRPEPGWLDVVVPHFDDPRVGAVAPRVRPVEARGTVLERYEAMSSALDMGRRPALVRPAAALGFLPSAALVVRRVAFCGNGSRPTGAPGHGFDETLRLGEDVDLVWRLADDGWLVRYEPSVAVEHEMRDTWSDWAWRRLEYGTSAAALEARHPGRLAPVRLSPWNAGALALLGAGRPGAAAAAATLATALLARRLRPTGGTPAMAASLVARGLVADAVAVGHAGRREYWPLGVAALATALGRRPSAARTASRLLATAVLGQVAWDWARGPRTLDPLRYTGVRLVADAAYGCGVQAGSWRARSSATLLPRFRRPPRPQRHAPACGDGRRMTAGLLGLSSSSQMFPSVSGRRYGPTRSRGGGR